MYLFIRNCILVSLFVLLASGALFYIFVMVFNVTYSNLPDPQLSNSFSFNEKMALIRNKNPAIMVLGSSVATNNIDSKTLVEIFNTKSFYNASSSGFTNKDDYVFIKAYSSVHKIKKLLLVGGMPDYFHEDKIIDTNRLKAYLAVNGSSSFSPKKFSLSYLRSALNIKRANNDSAEGNKIKAQFYSDFYGGQVIQNYIITPELKEAAKKVLYDDFMTYCNNRTSHDYNLRYLDSIVSFCKKSNIEFFYFQSPVTTSFLSARKNISDSLATLAAAEEKIIVKYGMHFVKTYDKVWDDSLFADYQHLNKEGASFFTKYCLDIIR